MAERRTAAKLIQFHPKELARIAKRARACGRTPACFIREAALEQAVSADLQLAELARIGRSLDQVAREVKAGMDPALTERVSAALDGFLSLVRQIVQDPQHRAASSAR